MSILLCQIALCTLHATHILQCCTHPRTRRVHRSSTCRPKFLGPIRFRMRGRGASGAGRMGKRAGAPADKAAPAAKPKAKAARTALPCSASAEALASSPQKTKEVSKTAVNASLQSELADYDSAVLAHPAFNGVMDDDPSGYSGVVPYCEKKAEEFLNEKASDYLAACPLFWLNLHFEPQPNLPKYKSRIENLRKHFFNEPTRYPREILVCHIRGDPLPHQRKAQLCACCPPELRDALRMALGMAATTETGEETLREWRQVIASIPIRFKVTSAEGALVDAFQSSVQIREDIAELNANMRMSNLLRSFEIMDLKQRLEDGGVKQNKKTLAQQYSKVTFANQSEPVTQTFVEHCLALHNNVLCVKEVCEICFRFDNAVMNPMDSVDKYRQAAQGCDRKPELMIWAFQMLWDHWCCVDGKDSIPLRALEGKINGWGGKSLTDLFLLKRQIRDLLYRRVEETNWPVEVKTQFRTWTDSAPAIRERFGTIDEPMKPVAGATANRALPASWPPSAEKMLLVVESLVYGYKYDSHLVKMMANRKTVAECIDHTDVSHFMSAFATEYEKEKENKEDEAPEEDASDAEEKLAADNVKYAIETNMSAVETLLADADSGAVTMMEEMKKEAISLSKLAERRMNNYIKFVPAAETGGVVKELENSEPGQSKGSPKQYLYHL